MHIIPRMNNTSNTNTVKRGRGRPRKNIEQDSTGDVETMETGITAFLEPTSHDMNDELARMDSYVYSRYNE
jgi:hypothetical protein